MGPSNRRSLLYVVFVLYLVSLALAACTGEPANTTVTDSATTEPEAPEEVVRAREALLNFLRSDANECVPQEGSPWQVDPGVAPEGFSVTHFHSDGCLVTVSYRPADAEPVFHVGLHSAAGICWQATVSAQGRVVNTGTLAVMPAELVEAAATYCQDAGYDYTVEEQPDGSTCGICTFEDGSKCKAWLYYQGECGPGER